MFGFHADVIGIFHCIHATHSNIAVHPLLPSKCPSKILIYIYLLINHFYSNINLLTCKNCYTSKYPSYQLSEFLNHLSRLSTTVRRWTWMLGRWGCSLLGWGTTPPMSSEWLAKKAWITDQNTVWWPGLRLSSWSRNLSWISTLSLTTCSCPSHPSIARMSSEHSMLKERFWNLCLNYLWGFGYLGLILKMLEVWCNMDWNPKMLEMCWKGSLVLGFLDILTISRHLQVLICHCNMLSILWWVYGEVFSVIKKSPLYPLMLLFQELLCSCGAA